MRRRTRLFAALGAAGVVALCLGVIGVAAATGVRGSAVAVVDADTVVPPDLTWTWVQHCELSSGVEMGESMGWFSTSDDGELVVEYGTMDDEGHLDIDEGLTAIIAGCVDTRTVASESRMRPASTAERLEIYDWAVKWQQPCLASRGMDVQLAQPADFVDPNTVPWYLVDQYVWTGPQELADIDFDVLLEARLACPPMPPFLAAQGVGW